MVKRCAVLLILVTVAFFGSSRGVLPDRSVARAQDLDSRAITPPPLNLDEHLLEIAKRDPAFGGTFLDRDGRITTYVTDDALQALDGFSRLAAMSVAIESEFRTHEEVVEASARRMTVLPAAYRFTQLYEWHEALKRDVLRLRGVLLTDIAESRNRLLIGVTDSGVIDQVEQLLVALGIPREAVLIEVTSPIVPMASIRSKVRPLLGGLQIRVGSSGTCTLGFLAIRAGVLGMVTNSHCTNKQGGVEDTTFYQASATSSSRIARETRDPAYFSGGLCPLGQKCRFSDTAFARIPHPSGPSVTANRGYIARPTGLNSVTFNTSSRFRITKERAYPLLNEVLHKVGRTTGWTQGPVIATCVTLNVPGTNLTLFCQDLVEAKVGAGDSGSPVFRITNSAGDVTLYGVLWGGTSSVYIFSAMGSFNIQRSTEMGSLKTCGVGSC